MITVKIINAIADKHSAAVFQELVQQGCSVDDALTDLADEIKEAIATVLEEYFLEEFDED